VTFEQFVVMIHAEMHALDPRIKEVTVSRSISGHVEWQRGTRWCRAWAVDDARGNSAIGQSEKSNRSLSFPMTPVGAFEVALSFAAWLFLVTS
jgi:hypothetical protein